MRKIEIEFTANVCEINSQSCIFCEDSNVQMGQSTTDFIKNYPRIREATQVIESTPNHYVISDIAPIIEDHLLVVSRTHFLSFAKVFSDIKGESEELIQRIVKKMQTLHQDKEIVLFEHGAGTIGNTVINCGGCGGNDHAHLHILPVPRTSNIEDKESIAHSVAENYQLNLYETTRATNLDFMSTTNGAPYLYLSATERDSGFLLVQNIPEIIIPSQLLRKEIATKIFGYNAKDVTKWHWRDMLLFNPQLCEERIIRTLSRWNHPQKESNEGT